MYVFILLQCCDNDDNVAIGNLISHLLLLRSVPALTVPEIMEVIQSDVGFSRNIGKFEICW